MEALLREVAAETGEDSLPAAGAAGLGADADGWGEGGGLILHVRVGIHVRFGESVCVVGSHPDLGAWDIGAALAAGTSLEWTDGDVWEGELLLPVTAPATGSEDGDGDEGQAVYFKFVVHKDGEPRAWEEGEDRVIPASECTGEALISCDFGDMSALVTEFVPEHEAVAQDAMAKLEQARNDMKDALRQDEAEELAEAESSGDDEKDGGDSDDDGDGDGDDHDKWSTYRPKKAVRGDGRTSVEPIGEELLDVLQGPDTKRDADKERHARTQEGKRLREETHHELHELAHVSDGIAAVAGAIQGAANDLAVVDPLASHSFRDGSVEDLVRPAIVGCARALSRLMLTNVQYTMSVARAVTAVGARRKAASRSVIRALAVTSA